MFTCHQWNRLQRRSNSSWQRQQTTSTAVTMKIIGNFWHFWTQTVFFFVFIEEIGTIAVYWSPNPKPKPKPKVSLSLMLTITLSLSLSLTLTLGLGNIRDQYTAVFPLRLCSKFGSLFTKFLVHRVCRVLLNRTPIFYPLFTGPSLKRLQQGHKPSLPSKVNRNYHHHLTKSTRYLNVDPDWSVHTDQDNLSFWRHTLRAQGASWNTCWPTTLAMLMSLKQVTPNSDTAYKRLHRYSADTCDISFCFSFLDVSVQVNNTLAMSQKSHAFVIKPMGNRDVTALPRTGKVYSGRLKERGYHKVYFCCRRSEFSRKDSPSPAKIGRYSSHTTGE